MSVLSRGNRECNDPEVGTCLGHSWKVNVTWLVHAREARGVEGDQSGVGGVVVKLTVTGLH